MTGRGVGFSHTSISKGCIAAHVYRSAVNVVEEQGGGLAFQYNRPRGLIPLGRARVELQQLRAAQKAKPNDAPRYAVSRGNA
eukprot:IDg8024t1